MLTISWDTAETTLEEDGTISEGLTFHLLAFDAVTSENHESTSTLTEHAVEEGSPLSDHKRINPRRLSIQAEVTNTPLGPPPPTGPALGQISGAVQKLEALDANVLVFDEPFDRIAAVFEEVHRLHEDSTPVTVSTRLKTYTDVQIVGVSNPRETADGEAVRFAIELQAIRIARTRRVGVQPREPRGRRTVNAGGQEPESPERTQRQSTARAVQERREGGESWGDAISGTLFGS